METTPNENSLTHVWVYNVCLYKDEPYLLLTRRKGYENLFWHLASGRITKPQGEMPSNEESIVEACVANSRELDLEPLAKMEVVCFDPTANSSWIDGVKCAHVLVDLGHVDKLPIPEPRVMNTVDGAKGVVFATWAKLSDIVVDWNRASELTTEKIRDYPLRAAASESVFYASVPLRSMVAKVLSKIVPKILIRYEPLPRSIEHLMDEKISLRPERRPEP